MTMRYMVIEKFKNGAGPVYERFNTHGRMMPLGLEYIDSWLTEDKTVCYQLMEAKDPDLFKAWTDKWADLVDFEIIPLATERKP
ncbi:DUF3303 domain-containing protein [Kordiimonas lacus]|uniref:DUF3303 domain-containing protein n=1 Tax=Kordiimonas lacus TaxID=637679 RepID=A0A1G6TWM1_9PROT|nr:DUF3303 family protein [Kordiimonas lacus]SDD33483.1 Protein of unknown function [Kordiimonas lacus]